MQKLKLEIIRYMEDNRHLTIKGNYQVFPVANRGVDFVGYRVFPDFVLLRSSTAKRMKQKLGRIRSKIERGAEISYSDYCCFNSYKGWLIYCNSHRLSEKYIRPLEKPMEEYYIKHLKNGGKKANENNQRCSVNGQAKCA